MLTWLPTPPLRPLLIGVFALVLSLSTAQAQDTVAQATNGGSGPSEQDKLVHYSLYWENYKNDNFASALKDLRWFLKHAPTWTPNSDTGDDRHFRRAFNAYSELAKSTEDPDKKRTYIDSAYAVVNRAPDRLERLDAEYDKYEWIMRKGRFVQQFGSQIDAVEEGEHVQYYRQAFQMAPQKIQPYYIDQLIKSLMEQEKQQKALEFMETVESKRGDSQEIQKILEPYRQQVFGRNPAARIEFMEKKLEENPDDTQLKTELFQLYMRQGYRDKAQQLSTEVLNSTPSQEIIQQIAKMRLEDGRAQEAFDLYQQGLEKDAEPSAQYYYNMGVAQRQMNNPAKARQYFRKAIDQDSSFGRAYISIGDLYAQAVSDCGGSKMARNDRAVYWLAVDMYQRAKQADPSVASTANSKISTYRQYFPTAEDVFYRDDWEEGESFRIDYGCYSWINRTTTVRKQ